MAVGDAGAIPYYSGWTAYDFLGLNSEEIAHGTDANDLISKARPTLLILYSPDGYTPSSHGLEPERVLDPYVRLGSVRWISRYHLIVYGRKTLTGEARGELIGMLERLERASERGSARRTLSAFVDYQRARLRGLLSQDAPR